MGGDWFVSRLGCPFSVGVDWHFAVSLSAVVSIVAVGRSFGVGHW